MKSISPYLSFDGQCEAALKFYAEAFGGQIKSMQRFGDSPMQVPAEQKARVMHAEFEAEGVKFMASDGMGEQRPRPGNNITLSVNLETVAEQDRIFNKLGEGGNVTMTLHETFWGARFGMLTDKFGIPWMFNCELAPKK